MSYIILSVNVWQIEKDNINDDRRQKKKWIRRIIYQNNPKWRARAVCRCDVYSLVEQSSLKVKGLDLWLRLCSLNSLSIVRDQAIAARTKTPLEFNSHSDGSNTSNDLKRAANIWLPRRIVPKILLSFDQTLIAVICFRSQSSNIY